MEYLLSNWACTNINQNKRKKRKSIFKHKQGQMSSFLVFILCLSKYVEDNKGALFNACSQ